MHRRALRYLREWKNRSTRKPLVIRGARQVGKSYLVRQFAQQEYKHLLYRQELYRESELHYWVREASTSGAEVDFVISQDPALPPKVRDTHGNWV